MTTLLFTLIVLGSIGILGAVCLFVISKKFHVEENPLIGEVRELLPGANCGACGLKGCDDFAAACVKQNNLDGLVCPGAGQEGMQAIAKLLGAEAVDGTPMVAVVKCNGTCSARPKPYLYDGAKSCKIMASVAVGADGCAYGCLGCGDCVDACRFEAIHINTETGLPEVIDDKCTACGMCVKACPRSIIELRAKGPKDRRVWVACSSRDKGAVARKICANACIGCMKCAKVCPFEAITIADNLSYIDYNKCKTCGKCVGECPTGAILTHGMPILKPATEQPQQL